MGGSRVQLPAYERDAYLRHLETEVVQVGEEKGRPWAILKDSLFYPEGGGQPADRGRLGATRVVDVQKREQGVVHYLEDPVVPGPVRLELDWERRFDHMQQHTAQHLLSAVAAERFGWETTSFHLGSVACDIELASGPADAEGLTRLEEAVMAEVRAARPVTARRVEPRVFAGLAVRSRGLPEGHRGDVRVVEIEGVDLAACGGTHLRNTAEIEVVKLLRSEALRGGVRLHWVAGGRARHRLGEREAAAAELRRLLGVGDRELVSAVAETLRRRKAMAATVRGLEARLVEALARQLAAMPGAPVVDLHVEDADGGLLRRIAERFVVLAPERCLLLTAAGARGLFFAVAAPGDARIPGVEIAKLFGGRGGGSGALFQGKATSLEGREEALDRLRQRAEGA